MPRIFSGDQLVVASHNQGKIKEIDDLLTPHGVSGVSAATLGLPEPEETGTTFKENAILKARAAASLSGLPALGDDSGLSATALDGAPGLYSARWAGPQRNFDDAMARLWQEVKKTKNPDHSAHFTSALALVWPDHHVEVFEGYVHGVLVWPPRGGKGFGYDPMFQPESHSVTFGEMSPDERQTISHRARAFHDLIHACFTLRAP